ncbi:MAG: hypothetical protein SFT92_09055 [Rickettsiales bacterium]|nr:hypothetical protein [Rickettsiales bacterium]
MLENPKFWIAVAFAVLIALSYKKLARLIAGGLDKRAANIKAELDQARALREEAEALLATYKTKQANYLKEAEAMLLDARKQADLMTQQAEVDAKAALDERTKHAVAKIAQEEQNAINDVKNHVVDVALAAARTIIADYVSTMSHDDVIKLAVSDIERKIH